MNAKRVALVASIFISGLACSTLPRPELSTAGQVGAAPSSAATSGAAPSGERRVALASGPAIVQISTLGSGRATLYLADDTGDGRASCPSPTAEQADAFKTLDDDDYAGDVPVPSGKRLCAGFDSPALSMDWLTEDYARPAPVGEPAPIMLARAPVASHAGVLIARQ